MTLEAPPEQARADWWRLLPTPRMSGSAMTDPAAYIPDQALIDAFNAAIALGQPLLISGDPGCGKTDAAHYLAWRLGLSRQVGRPGQEQPEYAMRFDAKSTTAARDLFYTYDAIGRFYAAQNQGDIKVESYISLQALGRAIVMGSRQPEARALETACGLTIAETDRRRAVVLIDEIDKAPRDVPNDLLVEMEKLQCHIQELNQTIHADNAHRPIVVLTSNSEQALPDAFLRRCVVYAMPFPGPKRLDDILAARIARLRDDAGLRGWLLRFFLNLRELDLERQPGTAELLGLAEALVAIGLTDPAELKRSASWHGLAGTILFKKKDDSERTGQLIQQAKDAGG